MTRLLFSLLIAVCCLILGSAAPAQELKRLYYGTTASAAHLPLWVAKDAGLFARHGLSVEPERDLTVLQLGAGPEMVAALESGRIAAAALTIRYALPFLDRGWPVLADLSKTDLVYPSSCVTSSRAYIRAEPKTTEDFLRAYVAAIALIRKDPHLPEKSFAKWLREKDATIVRRAVAAYAPLWKRAPIVSDKGIENVVRDLARKRPEFREYLGWPEPVRENGPLGKGLRAT